MVGFSLDLRMHEILQIVLGQSHCLISMKRTRAKVGFDSWKVEDEYVLIAFKTPCTSSEETSIRCHSQVVKDQVKGCSGRKFKLKPPITACAFRGLPACCPSNPSRVDICYNGDGFALHARLTEIGGRYDALTATTLESRPSQTTRTH